MGNIVMKNLKTITVDNKLVNVVLNSDKTQLLWSRQVPITVGTGTSYSTTQISVYSAIDGATLIDSAYASTGSGDTIVYVDSGNINNIPNSGNSGDYSQAISISFSFYFSDNTSYPGTEWSTSKLVIKYNDGSPDTDLEYTIKSGETYSNSYYVGSLKNVSSIHVG